MVNYVGVDINKSVQRPWLTGSLQFINGLGQVKAKYLLDYVKKHGYLASRDELQNKVQAAEAEVRQAEQLVKMEDIETNQANEERLAVAKAELASALEKGQDTALFGPCIYRNCAAFLIIRPNAAMDSSEELDAHPLDETRIHPENYYRAQSIATDGAGNLPGGDSALDRSRHGEREKAKSERSSCGWWRR